MWGCYEAKKNSRSLNANFIKQIRSNANANANLIIFANVMVSHV